MALSINPFFSVPFATLQLEDAGPLCASLRDLFLRSEGERNRNLTRRDAQYGLFESKLDLHTWPDAPVQQLFGFIHHALASTLHQLSQFAPQEYERLEFNYHSWFHITRNDGHQACHNHPMASWSGIFCVDPGDSPPNQPQSGSVRFLDPRPGAEMYLDAGNERMRGQYHQGGFEFHHSMGQLVLFPSYVYHEVMPYLGTRPRMVVAFNSWIRIADQPA